jgi:hypothetical protein
MRPFQVIGKQTIWSALDTSEQACLDTKAEQMKYTSMFRHHNPE